MKIKVFLLVLMTTLLSSSMIIHGKEEVQAKPCQPGNYASYEEGRNADNAFICKKVAGNNESSTEENALNFDGGNGPQWVQNFTTFLISLSVAVAYFSEAIAMLTIAYSAFLYTTSEGDTKKIRQAKMYLLYAFIGMFIGAFSLVISKMIGGAL